jgi:hypothetical protein
MSQRRAWRCVGLNSANGGASSFVGQLSRGRNGTVTLRFARVASVESESMIARASVPDGRAGKTSVHWEPSRRSAWLQQVMSVTAGDLKLATNDDWQATDGSRIRDAIARRVRQPTPAAARERPRFRCPERSTQCSSMCSTVDAVRHITRVADWQRRACAKRHSGTSAFLLVACHSPLDSA